jgi:hypothetical protein
VGCVVVLILVPLVVLVLAFLPLLRALQQKESAAPGVGGGDTKAAGCKED